MPGKVGQLNRLKTGTYLLPTIFAGDGKGPHSNFMCKECDSLDSYRNSLCRKCYNVKASLWKKNWSHKNPEKKRADKLRVYWPNLNWKQLIDKYEQLLKSHNYQCKICKTHQKDLKKELSVDHCHKTGKIRGLLCNNCNMGIGYLKDDPTVLKSAYEYLLENQNEISSNQADVEQ